MGLHRWQRSLAIALFLVAWGALASPWLSGYAAGGGAGRAARELLPRELQPHVSFRSPAGAVDMRERQAGISSITFVRSLYYIVKVMLALLVASLRRYPRLETARR